jgi:ketosteroid isomerase-like protein
MVATPISQRETIEEYISAYNALDVERMLSFVHKDVEFRNITQNEVNAIAKGIDELQKMAEHSRSFFLSRKQSITSFETVGDTVTVGINFEAVLAVDMPNGAKKGDTINLVGRSVFQFKDGKILRITDYS